MTIVPYLTYTYCKHSIAYVTKSYILSIKKIKKVEFIYVAKFKIIITTITENKNMCTNHLEK